MTDRNSRSNDVSASMGQMLLKGYKMLADSCPTCNSVLMQDKKANIICVNCDSLKSAAGKGKDHSNSNSNTEAETTPANPTISSSGDHAITTQLVTVPKIKRKLDGNSLLKIRQAEIAIVDEIEVTTERLQRDQFSEEREKLKYHEYLRECVKTLQTLQSIE